MIRQDCVKIKPCTYSSAPFELDCSRCHHYIPNPSSQNGQNDKKDRSMQNNLSDLNNALFKQLERLGNGELEGDMLSSEISRSQAMCNVSTQIINNAALALKAHTTLNTGMSKTAPKMLTE